MDLLGLASDLSLLNKDCEADPKDIADLKRYLTEGRCMIESLNPAYYAEFKTLKLSTGTIHRVCDCEHITELVGQSCTPCGSETLDTKFPQQWGKCADTLPDDCFRLLKIELNKDYLKVKPSIPEGKCVYVTIKCLPKERIKAGDESNVCECRDYAALAAYVMYRAILRDGDGDPAQIQLAQLHLKTFAEISGLQYQAAKAEAARIADEAS